MVLSCNNGDKEGESLLLLLLLLVVFTAAQTGLGEYIGAGLGVTDPVLVSLLDELEETAATDGPTLGWSDGNALVSSCAVVATMSPNGGLARTNKTRLKRCKKCK